MLGTGIVFAATVLLLIFGLTFLVSAAVVPAEVGSEKRFEKRLEYSVLGAGAMICWLVLVLMA